MQIHMGALPRLRTHCYLVTGAAMADLQRRVRSTKREADQSRVRGSCAFQYGAPSQPGAAAGSDSASSDADTDTDDASERSAKDEDEEDPNAFPPSFRPPSMLDVLFDLDEIRRQVYDHVKGIVGMEQWQRRIVRGAASRVRAQDLLIDISTVKLATEHLPDEAILAMVAAASTPFEPPEAPKGPVQAKNVFDAYLATLSQEQIVGLLNQYQALQVALEASRSLLGDSYVGVVKPAVYAAITEVLHDAFTLAASMGYSPSQLPAPVHSTEAAMAFIRSGGLNDTQSMTLGAAVGSNIRLHETMRKPKFASQLTACKEDYSARLGEVLSMLFTPSIQNELTRKRFVAYSTGPYAHDPGAIYTQGRLV